MERFLPTAGALVVIPLAALLAAIPHIRAPAHSSIETVQIISNGAPIHWPTHSHACELVLSHEYDWPDFFRSAEVEWSRCWEPT